MSEQKKGVPALKKALLLLCLTVFIAALFYLNIRENVRPAGRPAGRLAGDTLRIPLNQNIHIEMVWIPPTTSREWLNISGGEDFFMMGSVLCAETLSEKYGGAETWHCREQPQHPVRITRGFWLGSMPVTQKQWNLIMDDNPSNFIGPSLPVDRVNWHKSREFISALNELAEHVSFRLPTEAEWEYACRAGTNTVYHFGDDSSMLREYAWFDANSSGRIQPTGEKKPNPWGLHDMYGNVWEWCYDWYYPVYPGSGLRIDPTGPASGSWRVRRGGAFYKEAGLCRSALRYGMPADYAGNSSIGFRLAADELE